MTESQQHYEKTLKLQNRFTQTNIEEIKSSQTKTMQN